MPYVEKICVAGKSIFIDRYYTSRYKMPGIARSKNSNPTKPEQELVNQRKMERDMTLLMNSNFGSGDYHLVLTYAKDKPTELMDAKKDLDQFKKQMRRACKKNNIKFKYIVATEAGKRGALHHHIVINKMDTDIFLKSWDKGRVRIYPLDPCGQYSRLANYFAKYKKQWIESGTPGRGWSCSTNLIRPEPKVRIIKDRGYFQSEPKTRKGYYIDQDLTRTGYHDKTDYPFLSYVMIKIQEQEGKP